MVAGFNKVSWKQAEECARLAALAAEARHTEWLASLTGRLVVTGGRDYADERHVFESLDRFHAKHPVGLLAQGGSDGADMLSGQWAAVRGIPVVTYPADWEKHADPTGRRKNPAGPIRNRQMLDEFRPDWVVAFPGGAGTADCVKAARERGIPVWEVKPPRRQP